MCVLYSPKEDDTAQVMCVLWAWDRSSTHPKFDPLGVQTHDMIKTVHFMSLRHVCSNHSAISDPIKETAFTCRSIYANRYFKLMLAIS